MICKLSDIVNTANTGADAIKKAPILNEPTNLRCLRIGDVSQKRDFSMWGYTKTSKMDYERYKLHKGDSIIARTGNTIGVCTYIEDDIESVYNNGLIRLTAKKELARERFLFYLIRSTACQDYIQSIAYGTSTQPNMKIKDFLNFDIIVPTLEIQDKIIAIVDKIEKKIQVNTEINNNLEQQAQAIFKSWFVDFEPFGGVQPPEMKFVPLQELCKVVTKGTTPTTLGKPFTSSGINFIKAESILDSHSIDSSKFAFIDEETNALLKRSIIKANDIVFTIAGTLGRFAMVDNSVLPANTNQAVAIIRPDENKVTPAYLYSFFIGNWHNEYYSKRIQQAVQANLSLTTIKSLPIAVLSNTTMNDYDELVSPLFALMKGNEEENRRLSELRDTLLPKLMSGELDVSDIDL